MFPVDGLTATPIVGNLEVPSRTGKRDESFFGSATIGSSTNPKVETAIRNTLWGVSYDGASVFVTPTNGTTIKVFDQASIRELSICFDRYMLPTITYVIGVNTFIRYYDYTSKTYVVTNISDLETVGEIRSPRLTFDDRRVSFRNSGISLLGYYSNNKLIIRTIEDNFQSSQVIKSELTQNSFLEQIAMGDNNRLHFVTYTYVD